MKHSVQKISIIVTWAVFVSLGLQGNAWANDFERIFVFGDSLSDPGNRHALTGEVAQVPYQIIPSGACDINGFVYSNNKTWAIIGLPERVSLG